MSFHYPRRVKDLPTFEPDSEDDFNTPLKPKKVPNQHRDEAPLGNISNKENEGGNNTNFMYGSSTKSNSAFNMRMYPKRSSELPALESDSEEEDNKLNCAILNDSFIISEQDIGWTPSKPSKHAVVVQTSRGGGDTCDSFVLHFNKMAIESEVKSGPEQRVQLPLNAQEETNDKPKPLESANKKDQANNAIMPLLRINSAPTTIDTQPKQKQQENGELDQGLETPFKENSSEVVHVKSTTTTSKNNNSNAASTTTEPHFVTPQVQSFSVHRRPRNLCSTQSQKTRSAIVNEFRSQKVLFQTPMSVSRAPIPCTSNDSITLSLCDTIEEGGSAPSTEEKPVSKEMAERPALAKSKASLEHKFNAACSENGTGNDTAVPPNGSNCAPNSNDNKSVIGINSTEYSIVKKLGSGGSSSVYLAKRRDNNKEVALKVVDLRGDQAEGYLNETKLLAKLQGNVCVVALYEYQLVQKESILYLVMEKGDSDLHNILQTYTTSLPLYVLMNWLYQMLQAVDYIHKNGVIHSDLKPANFLMVNGRLKLIDFGIASNIAIDSTSIIKFSQAGTFNYISPEALTDTSTGTSPMRNNQPKIKISTKSDVWSLGCILYLLLYKKTPFSHIKNIYAKMSAICNPNTAIDYPTLAPYYPAMLLLMVQKCLQHNPKKRPSCEELLNYPFNMVIPIHNLTVPPKHNS